MSKATLARTTTFVGIGVAVIGGLLAYSQYLRAVMSEDSCDEEPEVMAAREADVERFWHNVELHGHAYRHGSTTPSQDEKAQIDAYIQLLSYNNYHGRSTLIVATPVAFARSLSTELTMVIDLVELGIDPGIVKRWALDDQLAQTPVDS